ncbi:baseplate complex protein [Aeromonas enterica]
MKTALLTLDGQPMALLGMKVSLSMQYKDKDQSGQTSSATSSEQGTKAKELKVTGLIPFKQAADLTALFALAGANDSGGQRHIYRIGSQLARAVKIRQVKFAGTISADEQDGQMAWHVSLTLREYNSVPEKREQRQTLPAASTGSGTDGAEPADDTKQPVEQRTAFEQFLKKWDDSLA